MTADCAMHRAPDEGLPAAALATEHDELVVAAIAAARALEAVRQDAALERGVERVFDELRQVSAGSIFGLYEEGRGVLLNQAVQRGLLGTVALGVNRGAIRYPLGLPTNGLRGRLPNW